VGAEKSTKAKATAESIGARLIQMTVHDGDLRTITEGDDKTEFGRLSPYMV
jgi:hypothetical protein